MKYINKLDIYLRSLPTAKFILIMTLISFIVDNILLILLELLMKKDVGGPELEEIPIVLLFLFVVIIVPIIETFIFQYIIIRILKKINFLKNRMVLVMFISAVVFGASHTYSIYYMFITFITGILLAYTFVVYEDKKVSAFWVTTAIHGLINGVSVVIVTLEVLYQKFF
ncbi:CPBP family intramembrane glutamic endopeptidase [Petrocella sp. FN5]|uniref:CPBP family intramembrane glutamic endopeptidase n=1 Tax=Petrocella sp. FN5 TaxID=3032002 RepID=UPI0023DB6D16|nr:CPBP family intramembrane glutamic endopeptidase [Petrocella sp. FN5]MDF1616779.1 CPBP family intramembrane metalloprotease [Petrocella sp. FN5]